MTEKTTSFKNQNLGLTSGWSQGELLWGAPLNDDLMILDAMCQGTIKKIIKKIEQQPVSVNKGDAFIYGIDDRDINLIGDTVLRNDIVIFKTASIKEYIVVKPKKGWKIFNKEDSSTYTYTDDENQIYHWEKESLIKRYDAFIDLPSIGSPKILYVVAENEATYFWNNDQLKYEKIASVMPEIDIIDCGDSIK